MPLIPKLQAGGISKVVESANVLVGTGGHGEAMQRLGQQIQNISLNLSERTHDAEAKDYAANRKLSDTLKIEDHKKSAMKEFADDPDGYNTSVKEFINTTYEESQDEAPTGKAQEYYKSASQMALFREQLSVDEFTSTQKLKNLKINHDKRVGAIATIAYQNSDPNVTIDNLKLETDLIESSVGPMVTRADAEVSKERLKKEITSSYFQGLLDKDDPSTYAIARSVLNDENSPINKALDVDQRSKIENKLRSAIKQKESTNIKGLSLQLNSATALMRGGVVVPSGTLDQIDAGLKSLPDSDQVRSARLNLAADRALMDVTQDVAKLNRAEWESKLDEIGSSVENAISADPTLSGGSYDVIKESVVLQSKNRLMTAMSGLNKELKKDSAGYAEKYFPGVRQLGEQAQSGSLSENERAGVMDQYITQSRAVQEFLGVSNPKILTASQADVMSQNLSSVGNADARSLMIKKIKSKYGDKAIDVLSELVEQDKAPPSVVLAAMSNNLVYRSRILSNSENQGVKIDNYRARFGQSSLDDLRNTVKEGMKEEMAILSRGDPAGANSALVKDITDNIVTDIAQRSLVSDSDGSTDDKLQEAKNVVLSSSVILGGGNSRIMMPLSSGNNHLATETFLNEANREKNIGLFNVVLTPEYVNNLKENNPDISDSEIKSRHDKQISRDSYWAVTKNPEEVKLMYQHPVYGPIDLYQPINPSNPKEGSKPIRVRFSEMKNIDFVQDSIGKGGATIVERRRRSALGGLKD